jgi:cytochrome c biogenesis protein
MMFASVGSTIRVLSRRIWHFLARLDIASLSLFILILLIAMGSFFPQRSSMPDLQQQSSMPWEQAVRDRYGAWTDLLSSLGIFEIFRSPTFIGLLFLLAFLTLICTLDHWKAVWRRSFHHEVICSDAVFDVSPLNFHIPASTEIDLPKALSALLREKGYRLQARKQDQSTYLRGDRNRLSPAATLVTHLGILLLGLGALLSAGFAWREELTISSNQPARLNRWQEITLQYKGFEIERHPDGNIANYAATIQLIRASQNPMEASLRLNEPLRYRGIQITLQGYQKTTDGFALALLAVHDPGYEPVIAGGFLVLLGLTVSFYFPHCCLHAHFTSEGVLRLAGRADRRACDFAREFYAITDQLKRAAEGNKKVEDNRPC